MTTALRNICIIAHVDHGKTTLVDFLLRQAGTFRSHEAVEERVMDSMDLERERGITIMAKNTSIRYQNTKINIVDTPGHADFGGEVERILSMVDGALLLVDAAEGPLPQTRFVLQKALYHGHKIVVVINKVDRPECKDGLRTKEVVNQVYDLFFDLDANEEQIEFPIIYACAREGWCTKNFEDIPHLISKEKSGSLQPLFETILSHVGPPKIVEGKTAPTDFQMLVSNLSYSDYVGRLAVGRINAGSIRKNQKVERLGVDLVGSPKNQNFMVTAVYTYEGLKQTEVNELAAGDIGVIAGSEEIEIGDTICGSKEGQALPRISVEKPTLGMLFSVNTSPLSGKEGKAIQSRQLRERLLREVRHNVALKLEETSQPDQFRVLGRGELQLAVLTEQMRREGLEFMIGKPIVLYQKGENEQTLEPMEKTLLDLPEEYVGEVTQLFQQRKGILVHYDNLKSHNPEKSKQRVRLEFTIPTRGLLGVRSKYLTATRGEGLFSSQLLGYEPHKGDIPHRNNGAIISDRTGETVEYGLLNLQDRGMFFVGAGVPVYEGMIIGEANKDNDLNVNPCREKKLTNIRAAHAEVLVTLAGIKKLSLEQCIEWIDEDEWIEVTPKSVRLRKKVLPGNMRSVKRSERVQ